VIVMKEWFKIKHPRPTCVGTGLVALDIVINGKPKSLPRLQAGGSCGNVLSILSYLGWKSYPFARLGDDVAGMELLRDMERWGVKTRLISRNGTGSTPIIVERIGTNRSGVPWHRFEWICPNCGSWLPKHKAVLAKDIKQGSRKMPRSQVFYFDRVAPSSLELAKVYKKRGSLIFFEPSAIKDRKCFLECVKLADIVKYSHERLGHTPELIQRVCVPLEIETLGAEGLRYRLGNNGKRTRRWKNMYGYTVNNLKDTAGAGDWCSAGIIHLLGRAGKSSFKKASPEDIDTALRFGQALSALNCYYEGARGSMYNISKQKFEKLIHNIWIGSDQLKSTEVKESDRVSNVLRCICPNCGKKNGTIVP
jgi:fructokinase